MQNPVPLKEIRDAMEMQSDEMTAYLHRPTGQVVKSGTAETSRS